MNNACRGADYRSVQPRRSDLLHATQPGPDSQSVSALSNCSDLSLPRTSFRQSARWVSSWRRWGRDKDPDGLGPSGQRLNESRSNRAGRGKKGRSEWPGTPAKPEPGFHAKGRADKK
ncbi:uncharacterized protein BDZ83DRAFT_270425 [Colletotrichum acutatum]|uniref:Uncharacterized protein n=1 Tax=Glomerella acutata TaxID=27357 RepID=A0AAD8XAN5_GLOAC|nr:uncharacterized protein BDZ83DRAFT_270425 [Colletotrichum acutatum]KAK1701688.1 hypothetical protein BDZ83DRAFT_270425 [Colletotrichum acutatum]